MNEDEGPEIPSMFGGLSRANARCRKSMRTGEEKPVCREHLPKPARKTYAWLVKRGWNRSRRSEPGMAAFSAAALR